MNVFTANDENISRAADLIKNGGLVAFPTETVYGLGANGLDPIATAKIFEAKNRPSFNPLILHLSAKDELNSVCKISDEKIIKLVDEFWPGPLTLVLPKKNIVPDIVTSGLDTVAVRMPDHPVANKLIKFAGVPIAAPSANKFGQLSPTDASHVVKQLGKNVDMILDGGKCSIGVESTIIQIDESGVTLLRPGGLAVEDIEKITGEVTIKKLNINNPNSPGQLLFHYAPNIPIYFINKKILDESSAKRIGAIFFNEQNSSFNFAEIKILSPSGNLREAAANLFKQLHELENSNLDLIVVEPIRETGLGRAIMDRLRKAVNKYS